jgi:hypothetical protein
MRWNFFYVIVFENTIPNRLRFRKLSLFPSLKKYRNEYVNENRLIFSYNATLAFYKDIQEKMVSFDKKWYNNDGDFIREYGDSWEMLIDDPEEFK